MMVLATVVGEFGLCFLLLCEEVSEAEVVSEDMEMAQVSLLHNLIMIMEEMFFYRQLTEMQPLFHSLRLLLIVM